MKGAGVVDLARTIVQWSAVLGELEIGYIHLAGLFHLDVSKLAPMFSASS
jgi:hypothetical protein